MRPSRLLPVVLLALACQKAGQTAERKVAEPADLIAVVSVASPKAALDKVRAYAEAVSPGSGAGLRDEMIGAALSTMVGAPALEGAALDKPTHLLVLDPKKHKSPLLLVTVADAKKLGATSGPKVKIEGKMALIGAAADVDLVAAYAFGVVAARPAPARVTATSWPAKLLTLYRADIEKVRQMMGQQMAAQSPAMVKILETEIDLFVRFADQTDQAQLALEADAGEASLELSFVPKAGTPFAAWTKVQSPGVDTALLEKLPPQDHPSIVMVGHVQLGPLRDTVVEFMDTIMLQVTGQKADRAKFNAWLDGFDGSMAAIAGQGEGGVMQLDEIVGAADGAKAAAQAHELFGMPAGQPRNVDFMGVKFAWQTSAPTKQDGVDVFGYEMKPDYATFPEMQREMMRKAYGDAMRVHFAGFDKAMVIALGPKSDARIATIVGTARKGGGVKLTGAAKSALDAGKARKASLVMFMDLAGSMAAMLPQAPRSSSGMSFELGVEGGAARFRIGMPAAHVRDIMGAFGSR